MTDNDVKQVTLTLNTGQAEQKLNAITQRLEEVRAKKAQAFEQGNAKAYTLYTQETKNSSDSKTDSSAAHRPSPAHSNHSTKPHHATYTQPSIKHLARSNVYLRHTHRRKRQHRRSQHTVRSHLHRTHQTTPTPPHSPPKSPPSTQAPTESSKPPC